MATASMQTEQTPAIGGMKTSLAGGFATFSEGSWGLIEYHLPHDAHLTGALICWADWFPGDHGYTVVANPAGMVALAEESAADQVVLSLPSAQNAAAFDPAVAGGEVWVELWDSGKTASAGVLRELVQVQSVNGADLHLARDLNKAHAAGVIAIPVYGMFSPEAGDDGTATGVYLLGSGADVLGSITRAEATELLATGLCLATRCYADPSNTGERGITINFSSFVAEQE